MKWNQALKALQKGKVIHSPTFKTFAFYLENNTLIPIDLRRPNVDIYAELGSAKHVYEFFDLECFDDFVVIPDAVIRQLRTL